MDDGAVAGRHTAFVPQERIRSALYVFEHRHLDLLDPLAAAEGHQERLGVGRAARHDDHRDDAHHIGQHEEELIGDDRAGELLEQRWAPLFGGDAVGVVGVRRPVGVAPVDRPAGPGVDALGHLDHRDAALDRADAGAQVAADAFLVDHVEVAAIGLDHGLMAVQWRMEVGAKLAAYSSAVSRPAAISRWFASLAIEASPFAAPPCRRGGPGHLNRWQRHILII